MEKKRDLVVLPSGDKYLIISLCLRLSVLVSFRWKNIVLNLHIVSSSIINMHFIMTHSQWFLNFWALIGNSEFSHRHRNYTQTILESSVEFHQLPL